MPAELFSKTLNEEITGMNGYDLQLRFIKLTTVISVLK